jgi:hypothetical protein
VLGIHGKLEKYVVHSSKRKEKYLKNKISSHKPPKQQSTNFWSQRILGLLRGHFKNTLQSFFEASFG